MTFQTIDTFRSLFQSKGFSTKTFIDVVDSKKQWVLQIIRQESVRTTLFFDYKTETLINITD